MLSASSARGQRGKQGERVGPPPPHSSSISARPPAPPCVIIFLPLNVTEHPTPHVGFCWLGIDTFLVWLSQKMLPQYRQWCFRLIASAVGKKSAHPAGNGGAQGRRKNSGNSIDTIFEEASQNSHRIRALAWVIGHRSVAFALRKGSGRRAFRTKDATNSHQ